MSDDRNTGDGKLAPNFIPDNVIEEFGEIARITVVARQSLIGISEPNRLQIRLDRFRTLSHRRRWLRLFLDLCAVLLSLVWLTAWPESKLLFTASSLLCVAAIVSSGHWIWEARTWLQTQTWSK